MRTIPKLHTVALFASVLLLCSCATRPHPPAVTPLPALPADVTMNRDAGRGRHLFVTLRLESGTELPFLVDTGTPVTCLDKSLGPQLGACFDTVTFDFLGTRQKAGLYAAPKLYLGHTPLMTCRDVLVEDLPQLSSGPLLGV